MARVSQEHLDARRRQILDGAARCFSRNGFHATSMQDVLGEVGLSAGAVYRYFRSKEELIEAIAEETFTGIRAAFDEAARTTPPPLPDVLVARVLRGVFEQQSHDDDGQMFARLVVQVWTETLRNEVLGVFLEDSYSRLRLTWAGLADAYRENGMLAEDISGDDMARTLIAAAQGFITQHALFGGMKAEVLENGLSGLMSMRRPEAD
ncbi:TetR/AcrR family transcriptional regulator [Streptomyces sp. NPDC051018]|uniref:TetR/AcrR family transcriptional regulator n=1 Tax=Streptomyces sp. NPDC051018 TaxID=3365639 RepID=UPI00379BD2D2